MNLKKESLEMMKIFEAKLDKLLLKLTLDKPSTPKYIDHIYADYIELNALFLKEEVTMADISDKLLDIHDQNIYKTALDGIEFHEIASIASEKNDVIENRFISLFNICKERESLYGADEYPFIVNKHEIKLKEGLSDKHKIYLLLLLSSNLNYFDLIASELTKDFELLSYHTLKDFLPIKAITKSFGKNSAYLGNARTKILTLASELSIEPNIKKIECISQNNTQERGLDIIAWMPFQDGIPNMLMMLCQCACGKDWDTKQTDTVFFQGYFHFDKTPMHVMFIPYSMCNPSKNQFHQHDRILDNLFFDRKRIIEQINDLNFMNKLQSIHAVEKCIQKRILM